LFKKRIPRDIVSKSLTVFGVSLTLVILITLILTFTENGHSFLNLIFETVSAFGTVGLSRNITSTLSDPGKILVIITMFAGRVGPVTLLVAISNYRKRSSHGKYRYPEGKISVG
jgi:trk system potassium uptake protein TrkH